MAVLGDIGGLSACNFSSSSLLAERRGNPHGVSSSSPFLESCTSAFRPSSKPHARSSHFSGRHCRQAPGLGLGVGIHGRYTAHLGSFLGSRVCKDPLIWSETGSLKKLLPLSPGTLNRRIDLNNLKRHGAYSVVACNPDDDGTSIQAFTEKNGHFGSSTNDKNSPSSPQPAIPSGNSLQNSVTENEEEKVVSLEHLKGLLQSALEELDLARLNSSKVEEDAQAITERAIALRDKATDAEAKAENAAAMFHKICNEELGIEELLSKGRALFAEAEARVLLAEEALNQAKEALVNQELIVADEEGIGRVVELPSNLVVDSSTLIETSKDTDVVKNNSGQAVDETFTLSKEEEELGAAQSDAKAYGLALAQYEAELLRIKNLKVELQKEALGLAEAAKVARALAVEADEEVTQVMSLAEQAVAVEVDAAQKVCIAEMALQKAEKLAIEVASPDATLAGTQGAESVCVPADELQRELPELDKLVGREIDSTIGCEAQVPLKGLESEQILPVSASLVAMDVIDDAGKNTSETVKVEVGVLQETDAENLKSVQQQRKDNAKEATPAAPKSSTKKSSRFFSASYFSFNDDEKEFTPTMVFQGVKQHFVKVSVGVLLLWGGSLLLKNRIVSQPQLAERTEFVASFEEVTTSAKPIVKELKRLPIRVQKILEKIPQREVNEEEASLFDVLWLLLASVIFVPIFQKLPGGESKVVLC